MIKRVNKLFEETDLTLIGSMFFGIKKRNYQGILPFRFSSSVTVLFVIYAVAIYAISGNLDTIDEQSKEKVGEFSVKLASQIIKIVLTIFIICALIGFLFGFLANLFYKNKIEYIVSYFNTYRNSSIFFILTSYCLAISFFDFPKFPKALQIKAISGDIFLQNVLVIFTFSWILIAFIQMLFSELINKDEYYIENELYRFINGIVFFIANLIVGVISFKILQNLSLV